MSRNLTFPFQIGALGVPRTTVPPDVIREQLIQLLFTLPGERVNRPSFGCGVQRLVFEGVSPEVVAATEYVVESAIQEHLRSLIDLERVRVTADEALLLIHVRFVVRASGERHDERFQRPLEAAP